MGQQRGSFCGRVAGSLRIRKRPTARPLHCFVGLRPAETYQGKPSWRIVWQSGQRASQPPRRLLKSHPASLARTGTSLVVPIPIGSVGAFRLAYFTHIKAVVPSSSLQIPMARRGPNLRIPPGVPSPSEVERKNIGQKISRCLDGSSMSPQPRDRDHPAESTRLTPPHDVRRACCRAAFAVDRPLPVPEWPLSSPP